MSAEGAQFAANLLKAGVVSAADWEATRTIGGFLERTIRRFAGNRVAAIDHAFDIGISLGTTASTWHAPVEVDPRRILLAFRVAHTVGWVNLTPALELLKAEHELLPAVFYHWLRDGLSRWFRVFDVQEARWSWESWIEMHEQDEAERRGESKRDGIAFEPGETLDEPRLPECVAKRPRGSWHNLEKLVRGTQARGLLEAAKRLHCVSRRARCPKLDPADREDLFPDSDVPIPLLALAFGEHDVITEFLNMELDGAGQVEPEPWPILKMDGTDPRSIRRAFRYASVALDTLEAAARTLACVPGFEVNDDA